MSSRQLHQSTLSIHADKGIEKCCDIAPPIHISTTFHLDNDEELLYAREDQPTRRRLERILGTLEGGHAVVYSSGQAAAQAALNYLRPRRVAINRGYFGTHDLLKQQNFERISLEDEFRPGDLIWLETPKNPCCEIEDIAYYVNKAHICGARVLVDSTLATPVLQNPLKFGVDFCMHSTSKFLSGHSDVLGGCLVVSHPDTAEQMRKERDIYGNILGNLETWLLLRSLRTLTLRVKRQSETATKIASWLENNGFKVWHPSRLHHPGYAIAERQMRGPGGILSFEMDSQQETEFLIRNLRLFQNAVSLGGVESLIDWRYQWDKEISPKLLRLSIGLEEPDDLIEDLESGISQTKKLRIPVQQKGDY